MQLLLQDKIICWIIYLQVLIGFSFRQPGVGIINPAHPLLGVLLILSLFQKRKKHNAFGDKKSWKVIWLFFLLSFVSASITLIRFPDASPLRPIGVIISLGVFFLIYYIVSKSNTTIYRSKLFFDKFIHVCVIHSFLTILDLIISSITGQSYMYLFLRGTLAALKFPNADSLNDFADGGRYKGLLVESGDVADFLTPGFAAMMTLLFFGKSRKFTTCFWKTCLMLLATIISGSSTALQEVIIISLLVVIVFIAKTIFIGKLNRKNLTTSIFTYIFLGVMSSLLGITLVVMFQPYLPEFVQDRISSLLNYSDSGSSDGSTNLSVQVLINCYNAANYTIRHSPFLGFGPGFFSIPFDQALSEANLNLSDIASSLNRDDGYSMLLRLVGESGICGTLVFISIFITRILQFKSFVGLNRVYCNLQDQSKINQINEVVLVTFAALIASLAHSLLNQSSYWVPITPILCGIFVKSSFKHNLFKGNS